MDGADGDGSLARFTCGLALIGGFDAVGDGVADEVQERRVEALDDVAVERGVRALKAERGLFLLGLHGVAEDAVESAEEPFNRLRGEGGDVLLHHFRVRGEALLVGAEGVNQPLQL